jgi:RNA polymerase sigma-70 factor, ECF subfamily
MPMQPDDRKLVQDARRGDRDAYAGLYDRYAGVVRAVCFETTGDLEHAQDLAQEVFLRAHRKLPTLRNDDRFVGWLIGIAHHVRREWLKRKRRDRKVRTGIPTQSLAVDSDASIDAEQRIGRALARLPEKQRRALHLYYLQGKSAAEAQRALAMSSSGFYKLLAQASDQITKLLETGE